MQQTRKWAMLILAGFFVVYGFMNMSKSWELGLAILGIGGFCVYLAFKD
jgi:TRAP-type C4-dicarboxylate transport system permease small subunit